MTNATFPNLGPNTEPYRAAASFQTFGVGDSDPTFIVPDFTHGHEILSQANQYPLDDFDTPAAIARIPSTSLGDLNLPE